ncbi:hypothetical protein J2X43_006015 [Rhizobium sp. BE258]|jgi:hypothetical protein|nr:hypothetical protein [Rhizobium sp. BE258]
MPLPHHIVCSPVTSHITRFIEKIGVRMSAIVRSWCSPRPAQQTVICPCYSIFEVEACLRLAKDRSIASTVVLTDSLDECPLHQYVEVSVRHLELGLLVADNLIIEWRCR